jgi:hypoxanthine phosphoribosyltransferase
MNTKNNEATSKLELKFPSWEEIYGMLLNLAQKIQQSKFKPDIIMGISRGGLVPARLLSDLLENPNIATVAAQFYVDIAQIEPEPKITQPVSVSVNSKKVLVVDDVADTGKSLKLVTGHLAENGASEVRVATVYYKPWSVTLPDYYETNTSCWSVFPGERKETVRQVLQKYLSNSQTVDDAKEKLISSGLNREHAEQFIQEVTEEKP